MGRERKSSGRRIFHKKRTGAVGQNEGQTGGRDQGNGQSRFLHEVPQMRPAVKGTQLSENTDRSMHGLRWHLAGFRRNGTSGGKGGWELVGKILAEEPVTLFFRLDSRESVSLRFLPTIRIIQGGFHESWS